MADKIGETHKEKKEMENSAFEKAVKEREERTDREAALRAERRKQSTDETIQYLKDQVISYHYLVHG